MERQRRIWNGKVEYSKSLLLQVCHCLAPAGKYETALGAVDIIKVRYLVGKIEH